MEGIENQKVLVLGLGATGRSAANFCIARGASVLAADERGEDLGRELEILDPLVECAFGQPFPDPGKFDLVVPSPGVPAERASALEAAFQAMVADPAFLAEAEGLKLGKLAQPLRVAVTGSDMSPSIDDTLWLVGKERTVARIGAALDYIEANPGQS